MTRERGDCLQRPDGLWADEYGGQLRMRGAILPFRTNLLIGGISSCLHSHSVNINCAMCEDSG